VNVWLDRLFDAVVVAGGGCSAPSVYVVVDLPAAVVVDVDVGGGGGGGCVQCAGQLLDVQRRLPRRRRPRTLADRRRLSRLQGLRRLVVLVKVPDSLEDRSCHLSQLTSPRLV